MHAEDRKAREYYTEEAIISGYSACQVCCEIIQEAVRRNSKAFGEFIPRNGDCHNGNDGDELSDEYSPKKLASIGEYLAS